MGVASIPGAVIRFIAHLPLFVLGYQALTYYVKAKKFDLLYHAPFSPHLIAGEMALGITGIAAFVWNFVMWLPSFIADGAILFAIGLVDLTIVVFLAHGARLRTEYLLTTMGPCKDPAHWPPMAGNLSFFTVINNGNITDTKLHATCQGYVHNWRLAIAMATLYGILATCNIIGGVLSASEDCFRSTGSYRSSDSFAPTWRDCGKGILKCPAVLFKLLVAVPKFFYGWLPAFVRGKLWYARRVTSKFARQDRELDEVKRTSSDRLLETDKPTLTNCMTENILARLSHYLHYVDIVNLSLVNKDFRKRVFLSGVKRSFRQEMLRVNSCQAGTKSQCWACNSQICQGCTLTQTSRARTKVGQHIDDCKLYCSDCFYTDICHSVSASYSKHHLPCSCHVDRPASATRYYSWNRPAADPGMLHNLCRACHALTQEALLKRREEQDKRELRILARLPMACQKCGVAVPTKGARWWVCDKCKCECKDKVHPSWAVKQEV